MNEEQDFQTIALPNGFKAYLKKTPANTIAAKLKLYHGALNEGEGEEGLVHLLEHSLYSAGTKDFPVKEINDFTQKFPYLNMTTGSNMMSVPANFLPKQLDEYLHFSSDAFFNPLLDAKKLESERKAVLREIADNQTNIYYEHFEHFKDVFFGAESSYRYPVIGKTAVVQQLTQEQIKDFHKKWFMPNAMKLFIVGDIPENAEELIQKYFSQGQPGELQEHKIVFDSFKHQYTQTIAAPEFLKGKRKEDLSAKIQLYFEAPGLDDLDYATTNILSRMLGGTVNSRLLRHVRQQLGLAYSIETTYYLPDEKGYIFLDGAVQAIHLQQAINGIFTVFDSIKQKKVSSQELQLHKDHSEYSTLKNSQDVDENLNMLEAYVDRNWDSQRYLEAIHNVTSQDIQRVAQENLPDKKTGAYALLKVNPLAKHMQRITLPL